MSESLPDRKTVKSALKGIGLSNRQIAALLAKGWSGLVDERDAELAELRDTLESLSGTIKHNGIS